MGGVEAAGAVNAGAGMGRGRRQVQSPDRRAVAEIRKHRTEDQLLIEWALPPPRSPPTRFSSIASRSAGVAMNRPRINARNPGASSSSRRSIDRRMLPCAAPSRLRRRRHVRVGPERVTARRCAAGIDQRLLADDEIRMIRQLAGPDLPGEGGQVGEAIAGVNDGGFACFVGGPRHRPGQRPVHLEGAPGIAEAPHPRPQPPRRLAFPQHSQKQRRRPHIGDHGAPHGDLLALLGRTAAARP